MIIWITGLSGAGKSTIGKIVYDMWRAEDPATVLVDGDEIRRILKSEDPIQDYSLPARRAVAEKIHNLCAWLDSQGINAVCCTISLFDDLLMKNKDVFSSYLEVYVSAEMETVRSRDIKDLYAPALRGEKLDVIGVDLPFHPPSAPDLIIENNAERTDLSSLAQEIMSAARARTEGLA